MKVKLQKLGGVLFAALFTLTVSNTLAFAEKGAELLMRNAGGGGLNIRPSRPPSLVESASVELPASRRDEWLAAGKRGDLFAKQKMAEEIGEDATRIVARMRGHAPLLAESELPHHGPDLPTVDREGVIHIYESKGGNSQLKPSRGYEQGTPENAIQFYRELYQKPTASVRQREVARLILERASEGKVVTHVVRGLHDNGKPTSISVSEAQKCSAQARQLAANHLGEIHYRDELTRSVSARRIPVVADEAGNAASKASSLRGAAKGLGKVAKHAGLVGLGVEIGTRGNAIYSAEQDFARGAISENERWEEHAANGGGVAGGVAGAVLGAEVGAAIGAPFGGVGAVPGAAIGGVVGAIGGGFVGDWGGSRAGRWMYRFFND
ncbi:MAG: hypothetical protein HY301_16715 [Verrucomicrobia bacterium]|nr:hypothetical protein [Verrucomicrobiota bacterium]